MQFSMLPLLSRTYSTTLKSNQTNKMFKIYHRVNCKSSFIIYLLECYICKIQHTGKLETPFNIRLNNHSNIRHIKDVKNLNAKPAFKHFKRCNHDFNNHRKTIIIEQLRTIRPHNISWDIKRKTKTARKLLDNQTGDFSATWSEPGPELNPFHSDFSFTSIIFCFCIWSKITGTSHKMMSNILQHL